MPDSGYHIAFFTSRARDLRYVAVLIRSITEHFTSPEKLVFHFLFYDLNPNELAKLTKSVEDLPVQLRLQPVDDVVGERKSKPDFGYWARIWLGRVIPRDLERVLYLDCDMIAYKDIRPLWETDLSGYLAAAVVDPGSRVHGCVGTLEEATLRLNLELPLPRHYVNSGLLFINMKLWREARVLEQVEKQFHDYQALRFHDQDALNLLLGDRIKIISPEWNLVESILLYEDWDFELYQDFDPTNYFEPRLRHFSGNMKPDGINARASERALFYSYLDKTVWRGWRSPASKGVTSFLWGHLLDFHYAAVRGLKQGAIRQPLRQLLRCAWKAPYAPIIYPLLPLYRLYRRLRFQ